MTPDWESSKKCKFVLSALSQITNTLKQVSRLIELEPDLNSAEGEQLKVLSTLILAYEAKNFSIERPDPIEAIKFRMEQNGLTAKDLEPRIIFS